MGRFKFLYENNEKINLINVYIQTLKSIENNFKNNKERIKKKDYEMWYKLSSPYVEYLKELIPDYEEIKNLLSKLPIEKSAGIFDDYYNSNYKNIFNKIYKLMDMAILNYENEMKGRRKEEEGMKEQMDVANLKAGRVKDLKEGTVKREFFNIVKKLEIFFTTKKIQYIITSGEYPILLYKSGKSLFNEVIFVDNNSDIPSGYKKFRYQLDKLHNNIKDLIVDILIKNVGDLINV